MVSETAKGEEIEENLLNKYSLMDHAIKGPRFEMKPKEVILDVNERQSPENDRQPQENDKQLQENGSQSQENDRQPQENDRQPQENDRQPQENVRQPQENDNQPQENDNQPQENDRQPYENDNQSQENDRQKRDRLRRLLLEEAKKRQLEKKIKKTARRKARNKKLPSIAASSDQTSARSSPDYTNLSNGCFMEKTVSSLQKDESMNKKLPSIAASSDQTSARSSPDYTNLSNGCFMEKTVSSLQKDESMMSSDVFDHHKPLHLGNFDILTDIDVKKSEDGITVVRKHQGSMMLKRAQMTLKEGQELLKTCVSSTSAVLQHLQAVSSFTLAVRGHCCLKFCNCFGDDDLSPCNVGAAEHCGTKCIDSDQPSIPCLSLLPSSSASDLLYIHQEAETEILSCLHKPQFQRHLPLNVGSMQLQGSLVKIILSHSLSQNYPETDTSKEDLKHKHGIVPYRKFLCQNLQQSQLQVMLTKSSSGSVFCALMDMRYYQKNVTSWPFCPVLRDISCQMFSSQRRSSLKKCNATLSARFKVQVAERVCEASGDKMDVAVDNSDVCQSEESLKEMHTLMQCENDESVPTTAAQFVPGIASFENTEFTHVDEVSQNVEFYSLTAADRHADLESCQDTHNHITDEVPQNVGYSTFLDRNPYPESCRGTQNHTSVEVSQNFKDYSLTATVKIAAVHSCQDTHGNTSDEGYLRDEHLLNERKVASDLWCPIRQEFVPDNWDDDISSDEDIIDSASNCVMTDASISTPAPTTPHRELFVESCIEIDNNEKQCRKQPHLDVEISEQNISCCQEVVKNVTGVCDNKPKQKTGKVCAVRKVDKRKCEGNDQVTLPRMTIPLLSNKTVMSTQQQRETECLHEEHQLLNKPELKLHQSTDLGSFTEAERNKSPRKWEFIPDSVLKKGTAEASVNRPITDYECRQNVDECLHERLTQGNSDSLIYAECYANQQIYNNALPVNNESTKYSIPNNSAQNFTTIHPTLLHPSTFPVASSNLGHGPTKSDLNNLLALTLEKEQERLYLLFCDLQAKVLELARMMKAHNIVKSPLAAEDDIDSFKSAGLLPGEKELSLEKIEAILDRFVLVANKCLIPATEHTSAKSIKWNKHAQRVQNTFPFQSDKREKQTNQREFSDAEVDNILKRLDMLYINDQKTPHTRGQSTAHSINQSSQDGSLNSDRYFQDPQFPSRLPNCPPEGFEQKYRLGKASTQLQTQVSQNKKTNKTVSSCQDGADQFIPCHGILSRNSADVAWNRQELQGQMQLGNPRKSHTMAGSFTTADSPVNSTQENRTNIPKDITPYNLLRRRVIRMSDYSLSEKKHRETETRPDLGEVALPTKVGHSPPDFREPSKSFSLSASALPVFRKNVAMQKTKSSHNSYCLPSLMERPVLSISKTLPKKADECNSKDGW